MRHVIIWELKQRKWSIMWWSLGIVFFIAINLAFYPSFRDQSQELANAFNDIPESAMSLISDTGDFFSPVGYLSSQVYYLMLPMLLGILCISLGSSLLAKEERDGTIELLLSRPISRSKLLAGKALAGIIIVSVMAVLALITTILLVRVVKLPVGSWHIIQTTCVTYLLSLSFGAVAFLLTSTGRARAGSIGIATLFALGGYIIASLQNAAEWLRWPARFFPFNYYQPAEILQGTYNWNRVLFIFSVITMSAILSTLAFRKRDITT